jgi:hypothetical protein
MNNICQSFGTTAKTRVNMPRDERAAAWTEATRFCQNTVLQKKTFPLKHKLISDLDVNKHIEQSGAQ